MNITENILSQFNANDLEIKLTNEKLFINTATSTETFALRSVNGIGVVDLVEDYNKALTEWKKQAFGNTYTSYFLIVVGLFIVIAGFFSSEQDAKLGVIIVGLIMSIGGYFLLKNKKNEPILMSAVRIMMSGGNRDFQFDKMGIKSGNVAEFVANVESTLTAYHKNNE
jgi:hypothetical protein